MKVFISFSGNRSLVLANALRRWLKLVVQSIEPWVSSEDISAGQHWGSVLQKALADSRFGIICVTPENIGSPWLMYEAGAIAREGTHVVPLLLNLTTEDLSGPLAQFQSLPADIEGIRKLVGTLHRAAETKISERDIATIFDALWPKFQLYIEEIPSQSDESAVPRRAREK